MQNDNIVNTAKIARLCRVIRVSSLLFVVSVAAVWIATTFWPDPQMWSHPFALSLRFAGLSPDAMNALGWSDRLLVASFSVPYLLALLCAFLRLSRMLAGFERGQFFERATVGHLRAFAGWLLVAKALSLLAMHARVGALIHFLGHERVHAVVNLSSDDVAVLLMCTLLFLIARMMEVGRELAEENRSFV